MTFVKGIQGWTDLKQHSKVEKHRQKKKTMADFTANLFP